MTRYKLIAKRVSDALAIGLLTGAACCAGPAWAGAGIMNTTVKRLAENVTYSSTDSGFVAYIGYEVSVSSAPSNTNTINNVVFTGTLSATDPAEKPTFAVAYWKGAEGAPPCTPSSDGASISCSIGTLRAGVSYPTFALFFKVPAKVEQVPPVPPVADAPGTDFLKFSGITYFSESGTSQPPVMNSAPTWGPVNVALGTSFPEAIRSSVPKSGGKFFTGTGISTGIDPFATTVTVPTAAFYTGDASIVELPFGLDAGCVNFDPCFATAIDVPGSFEHLTIMLRQDKSTIRPGTKIESVLIWYDGSDAAGDSYHGYLDAPCLSPGTPLPDRPCIDRRKYYKNKAVSGWTPELDGDFEWTIITNKNGGYKVL